MQNPDFNPPVDWDTDDGEFICTDAGKIDLILVSKNSKNGENHFFAGASDYAPVFEGAGDDPADFEDSFGDGIDVGCLPNRLCPCAVDAGEAGVTWRAAIAALKPSPLTQNSCDTHSYAPHSYRLAGAQLPGGVYDVVADSDPNYLEIGSYCGAYLDDDEFVLPTTELQHNACVRLIDSVFGEATDRNNGDDCTIEIP